MGKGYYSLKMEIIWWGHSEMGRRLADVVSCCSRRVAVMRGRCRIGMLKAREYSPLRTTLTVIEDASTTATLMASVLSKPSPANSKASSKTQAKLKESSQSQADTPTTANSTTTSSMASVSSYPPTANTSVSSTTAARVAWAFSNGSTVPTTKADTRTTRSTVEANMCQLTEPSFIMGNGAVESS